MIVYICSPYRSEDKEQFEKQLEQTMQISRTVVLAEHEVIVPHLYYTRFLNDNNKEEREKGIKSALKLLDICDAMFVYIGLKVSSGMEAEMKAAKQKDIAIYYFRNMNELKDILKKLDIGQGGSFLKKV